MSEGREYTVIIQLNLVNGKSNYVLYGTNGSKIAEGGSDDVCRVMVSKYCSVNVSPWLSGKGVTLVIKCLEEPKVDLGKVAGGCLIKVM